MKLSELIRKREVATVTVATHATVTPIYTSSVATVTTVNVATEADGKPKTLLDRQRETRRQKIIAMLEAAPGTQRAIYVDDASDPENITLTIAVRHPIGATCEMLIPRSKYDSWKFLELLERLGQTIH
jgi:hypothetical protein